MSERGPQNQLRERQKPVMQPMFVKEDDLDRPEPRVVQGRRRKRVKVLAAVEDSVVWEEHVAVLKKCGVEVENFMRRFR